MALVFTASFDSCLVHRCFQTEPRRMNASKEKTTKAAKSTKPLWYTTWKSGCKIGHKGPGVQRAFAKRGKQYQRQARVGTSNG